MSRNQQTRGLGCIEAERIALITGYPDTHFLVIRYPDNHFAIFSTLFTVLRSTPVENVRQITPFYAKQTQFYAFFARKRRFHKKTNPIQTQFNPKQTQLKPKQTQFQKILELTYVFKTIYCEQNYEKITDFENKLFLTKGQLIWYR